MVSQVIKVPDQKHVAMLQELQEIHQKQSWTKRALLSLIGKLAFAAKAVPAGRIFLRRLLDASTKVRALHHRLSITVAMRDDIDWWIMLARSWNGKSFFLESTWTPSPAFQLFTDASDQGYGCYWQGHWLQGTWSQQQSKFHIQRFQWWWQHRPGEPSGLARGSWCFVTTTRW